MLFEYFECIIMKFIVSDASGKWQELQQDKSLMICVCLKLDVSVCVFDYTKRVQFIRKLSVKHTLLNYFTTLIVVLVLTSQSFAFFFLEVENETMNGLSE